jgi:hypothetical protein
MSGYESLFSFYGLLLGLAVAAVASGLGDLWRRRRKRPVGMLLPLLGLYILMAATQQWMSFWAARESLDMSAETLLIALGMALPYGFTAQIMFPEADDPATDGDAHFLQQRRVFLGVLMVPLALSLTYNLVATMMAGALPITDLSDLLALLVAWVGPLAVLGAMIPIQRRAWHAAGLIALIADRTILIFLT